MKNRDRDNRVHFTRFVSELRKALLAAKQLGSALANTQAALAASLQADEIDAEVMGGEDAYAEFCAVPDELGSWVNDMRNAQRGLDVMLRTSEKMHGLLLNRKRFKHRPRQ